MIKSRVILAVFFAASPLVLSAQNVNGTDAAGVSPTVKAAPKATRTAVENFPSRKDAQENWEKQEPRTETAFKGPNANIGPPVGVSVSSNRIKAEALPDPKIDYVKEAVDRIAPMAPADMRKFADEMYRRGLEMSNVPGGPYEMRGTRQARVSFEPGAKPQSVSVALGMGAVVSFIDRNGAPLVIDGVKGFSDAFSVNVMDTEDVKKNGSPEFEIEAKRLTGQGNVSVRLAGISTPVLLNVAVGKTKETDGSVQFLIPTVANNSKVLPGDRMEADSGLLIDEMQGFLAGIPPEGAVEVKVTSVGGVQAWMWRNRLYMRTVHTVFSPGWFRRQPAADGTAAYELPLTSVVYLGVNGREMQAVLDYPYIPASSAAAALVRK